MTMPRRIFPLLCLVTSLLPAQQSSTALPEALTAHLRNPPLLHVDFTQTRTLAALSRPLKTTGRLVLAKDQGVIWHVKKPVSLTYVIGPKGMLEIGADGQVQRKAVKEVPAVAQMGRILQALLQGQWSALDHYFTIIAEGRAERWKIVMTARSQKAAFVKGIAVSGAGFIERIQVEELSGDGMELVFEHPDMDAPLSEAELRLLKFE